MTTSNNKQQITHDEGIKEEQLKNILKAVPPRFKNLKPDFELLKKLQNKSILISGRVGVGKTYKMLQTIIAYMVEAYDKPFSTIVTENMIKSQFLSVPNILRMIKLEFDDNEPNVIVEKLINKDVLFLDDLGAEKASDWVKEQLYIVLNERYNWCRPTMFTTNLHMKEIAEHYGERFASRLVEMCEVIKIEAPDRRLEKGE